MSLNIVYPTEIPTCDTSLWFSLSHACLMVVLWSKRWASSSSFSWRISSLRRATPRSCSAFSSFSQAWTENDKTLFNIGYVIEKYK